MNNDLVNSLLEIMMEKNKNTCDHSQQLENNSRIGIVPVEKQLEKSVISHDVYKEATELTHAEQLAHEVRLFVRCFYLLIRCFYLLILKLGH